MRAFDTPIDDGDDRSSPPALSLVALQLTKQASPPLKPTAGQHRMRQNFKPLRGLGGVPRSRNEPSQEYGSPEGGTGNEGSLDTRQEPIAASSSFPLCPSAHPVQSSAHRAPDSISSAEPAAGGLARAIEPWMHSVLSQESSGSPQCPAPRCGVLQGSPSEAPSNHGFPLACPRNPPVAPNARTSVRGTSRESLPSLPADRLPMGVIAHSSAALARDR